MQATFKEKTIIFNYLKRLIILFLSSTTINLYALEFYQDLKKLPAIKMSDSKIEAEILEFYQSDLGGIDLSSAIKIPDTPEQQAKNLVDRTLAGTSFVIALSKDTALVFSAGKSEILVKKYEKEMKTLFNGYEVITLTREFDQNIKKGDSGRLAFVKVAGQYGAGKIPVVRTIHAIYKVNEAFSEDERNRLNMRLAEEYANLIKTTLLAQSYERLKNKIDNTTDLDARRKNEYKKVVEGLVARYAEVMLYKDRVKGLVRNSLITVEQDFLYLLNEISPAKGQGTVLDTSFKTWDYGLGFAVKNYVEGSGSYEDIRKAMYSKAREVAGPWGDFSKRLEALLRRDKKILENSRTEFQEKYFTYDKPKQGSDNEYASLCIKLGTFVSAITPPLDTTFGQSTQVPEGSLPSINIPESIDADFTPKFTACYRNPQDLQKTGLKHSRIIAIVDSSRSMEETDPKNLRIEALKMMLDSLGENIELAIIDFDSQVTTILQPERLGSIGGTVRESAKLALSRIDSAGGTEIAKGLQRAYQIAGLDQHQDLVTFVLMSDGKDNRWKGDVNFPLDRIKVHTIALSDQADQESLGRISAASGGIAEVARDATDLHRIFANLFGEAGGQEVLLVKSGIMKTGERLEFPFPVEPALSGLDFQVTLPGSDIDLSIIDPNGGSVTIDDAVRGGFGIEQKTYDIIHMERPVPGKWKAVLDGIDLDLQGEPYSLRVLARDSAVKTRWIGNVAVPEVGDSYSLSIEDEGNATWTFADIAVWMPNGTLIEETRTLGGLTSLLGTGSGETIFDFVPAETGIYRVQINLSGVLPRGEPLIRTLDRSFRVAVPGKGLSYRHDIDPFIRRIPGMLE